MLQVRIKGQWFTALVDSGAEMNGVDPRVVNHLKLPWKDKDIPYGISDVEGKPFEYEDGQVTREVDHLKVFIEGKNQGVDLDIIPLQGYDLLLGYPWLYRYDPLISWRTGQVQAFRSDAANDTDNDSDDTRSQTSIEEDEEVRRSNNEDTPQPTEKARPPKGTRHKHKKGQAQQTRRTIAFLKKTFAQKIGRASCRERVL